MYQHETILDSTYKNQNQDQRNSNDGEHSQKRSRPELDLLGLAIGVVVQLGRGELDASTEKVERHGTTPIKKRNKIVTETVG